MVLMFLIFFYILNIALSNKTCTTPNGEQSLCISITKCQVFIDELAAGPATPSVVYFMRKSSCGFSDKRPMVCCGSVGRFQEITTQTADFSKHRNFHLLPTKCGIQDTNEKFQGGIETQLNEFPWMALIEYKTTKRKGRFFCSAALISNQYLLTTAHCVKGDILRVIGTPFSVRVGDHDLATEIDCRTNYEENYELCTADYQDVDIERTIPHPKYNSSRPSPGDIALIRLKNTINETVNVRPICLPLNGEVTPPGKRLFAAGWGTTTEKTNSNVKLKVSLPVIPNQQCNDIYNRFGQQIEDNQLCAGGELGQDTCKGDTGGPVMTPKVNSVPLQWYAEGIVSFGATPCGLEGVPGVNTRVGSYINWILDNME